MSERDETGNIESEITAAQWRQIVSGASDMAIISTDECGFVTSWNSGASRILGWNESEMLGNSLSRIFADGDGQEQLRREMEDACIGAGCRWRSGRLAGSQGRQPLLGSW